MSFFSDIYCAECGLWGHSIEKCYASCYRCGDDSHHTDHCIRCYDCGQWGHGSTEVNVGIRGLRESLQ